MSVIERVARKIHLLCLAGNIDQGAKSWEDEPNSARMLYRTIAYAAIADTREPSDEQVQRVISELPGITVNSDHVRTLFRAMCDAALEESP